MNLSVSAYLFLNTFQAAHLLPIISNLLTNDVSDADHGKIASARALIIAPRRELAVQIYLQAREFSLGSRLNTIVIYGGVGVACQLSKLLRGSEILVATANFDSVDGRAHP